MSRGRISNRSLLNSLVPLNSVSDSLNVNFDTTIGAATVRSGTTRLGSIAIAGFTPLGLSKIATAGLGTNTVVAVFAGASNASIYYYDGSWHVSGVTNLSNTLKNRFAMLGGRIFRVNGFDPMSSSQNGNVWGTGSGNNCTGSTILTNLVFRQKGRLLTSGDSTRSSRVYFSSIIDQSASPYITWNTTDGSGDYIDVNPDDGDYITGFAETATLTLVFKSMALYRLDVINKTVDTENIFNIGAVSQEAIVRCQGVVYFFSGIDIRRTAGDLPEQISRLGVQDYIDAIPQSSWGNIAAGTDGNNVYFSIGNITLNTNKDGQVTRNNVVLKFSPRDEAWSVHSYAQQPRFYLQYTTSAGGVTLIEADTNSNVQTVNSGTTDNSTAGKPTPIYYFTDTQEIDFGDRSHSKGIADTMVVYTNNGLDSQIAIMKDNQDFKASSFVKMDLSKRVNIGTNINVDGFKFMTTRWFGESAGTPPVLEGISFPLVSDNGLNNA